MWKTQVGRAIREVRFVLKQAPEHHGAWRFVFTQLPELMKLNQNTYFTIQPIVDNFETPSACHIVYGDTSASMELIETANLSPEQFVEALKQKVAHGLTLKRKVVENNADRDLPIDIIEAHEYVKYQADSF